MQRPVSLLVASLILTTLWTTHLLADQTYSMAVLPRNYSIYMHERFSELADQLEARAGIRVELDIAGSYEEHISRVKSGGALLGFQNPLIYIKVSNAVTPVAVAKQGKGGEQVRGLIIVRRDSGIKAVADLRGKKVAVVSTQSAAGYFSQKEFFKKKGIDTVMDLILREAADNVEENVLLDVFEKRVVAGCISASSLHRMDRAIDSKMIRILARTDWVPAWVFTVHRSVKPKVVQKIKTALTGLPGNGRVLKAIEIDAFAEPSGAYLKRVEALDFW
jgi:phosphonate transport system substrate-binding protein